MPKYRKIVLATSLLSLAIANHPASAVGVTQSVEDALNFYHYGNKGAVKIDLNYRYENVNQDLVPDPLNIGHPLAKQPHTANGNTLRLRAGLLSPVFFGFQGYAEYEGNLAMQEDFNSTRNDNKGFSTIADPEKANSTNCGLAMPGFPTQLSKVVGNA